METILILIMICFLSILIIFLVWNTIGFFTGAPFAGTPQSIVDELFTILPVKKNATIYDLGSGDGRLLITAANHGILAIGYETNPILVFYTHLQLIGMPKRLGATVYWRSFWKAPLKKATIVFAFLLPEVIEQLEFKFSNEIQKGSIVVTYLAPLPGRKPFRTHKGLRLYRF